MANEALLDLVMRVRAASGRPLDAAGQQRMLNKISSMSASEVTLERVVLKKLLDYYGTTPVTPNRNRP